MTAVHIVSLPIDLAALVKLNTKLEKAHGPLEFRQNAQGTRLWFIKKGGRNG